MIQNIQPNETSFATKILHKIMRVLQLPSNTKEVLAKKAGTSTQNTLRDWQEQQKIPLDNNSLVDNTTALALRKTLKSSGYLENTLRNTVSGKVKDDQGNAVSRIKLLAFDIDLKGIAKYKKIKSFKELLVAKEGFDYLGEVDSDKNGLYEITYFDWMFAKKERKSADVIVFALKDGAIVGRSRFNQNSERYLKDVTIKLDAQKRTKGEYKVLNNKIQNFLKENNMELCDITQEEDYINFISGELDQSQEKLYHWLSAHLLADNNEELMPELLYGLARQNIEISWERISKLSDEVLLKAIKNAVADKNIDHFSQKIIAHFIDKLSSCAIEEQLKPTDNKPNRTDELLTFSLSKKQDRVAFLKLKKEYKGTDENDFWENYLPQSGYFNNKLISALRKDTSLLKLIGFDLPLAREIKKSDTKELKSLVKWDHKKWFELVSKIGVPAHVKGKNKADKIKNYIHQLQGSVNTKFTSSAIQHKISADSIVISNNKVKSSINKFLNSDPDFDIKTSSIKNYENQIRIIVGSDTAAQAEVLGELNGLQRMVRINPDTSLIGIMKNKGLTSALAISEYPRKTFALEFGKDFGGEESAFQLYEAASTLASTVSMTTTAIDAHTDLFTPGILRPYLDRDLIFDAVEQRFPGYSEAFNVNLCECQHCNSVYGPAAYFVDLMRYLDRGVKNDETSRQSPLDIFKERRPDLFHLPLTCENSNTLIPYIDLANEVMENYIFYTDNDLSPSQSFQNYQSADTGDLSSEELRAQPQNIQQKTYQTLSEKVYPLSKPFHLPLEILRSYSKQMGSSWHEIVSTLNQSNLDDATRNQLNSAYLHLSPKEFEILIDPSTDNLPSYYGFTNPSQLIQLNAVPTFLEHTQLKYTELIGLFKTNYINPGLYKVTYLDFLFKTSELTGEEIYSELDALASSGGAGTVSTGIRNAIAANDEITLTDFRTWVNDHFNSIKEVLTLYQENSNCDISSTTIRTIQDLYNSTTSSEYLTDAMRIKLHTFIRLWRKTAWSMHGFDAVISSLGTTSFNAEFLNNLSFTKQFIDEVSLNPRKAAVMWGTLDYRTENNVYQELFLNRTIEIPETFIPSPARDLFAELTDSEARLFNFTPELLAAFKISEEDLQAIYEHAEIDDKTNRISIEQISLIYRHVLFASACEVSIQELIKYFVLLELNPFVNPKNTLDAYQSILKIKETAFKAETLSYVLENQNIPHDYLVLEDSEILDNRASLLEVYAKIETEDYLLSEGEILEEVRENLKRFATYEHLSLYLSISPEIVKTLMESEISTTVSNYINSFSDLAYANYVNGLLRTAVIIDNFELETTDLSHLLAYKEDFDNLNFGSLTLTTFWRLIDYAQFKEELPQIEKGITAIFKYAKEAAPLEKEMLSTIIEDVTQWNSKNINYLLDEVYPSLEDFNNEKVLLQMLKTVNLARKMGVTVESLYSLEGDEALSSDAALVFNDYWSRSQKLKHLLKAKYDHSTWVKVSTKLNDSLREEQRDALVSYLLTLNSIKNHELQVTDANGLYEFFLLDVQMSSCMDTSRIVQASAAIQQFVNRTHLNLEKGVKVEALDRARWTWMRNYRVWESQMRVIYENVTLLNPEWRMDKSPFFKELESYLTQNDITDRTTEEALRAYLKSMDDVSNLNIAGMYEEKDENGNLKLLHVFGHTNNTPYVHYYRTFNEFGKWSAWEKVDAAIQAVSNNSSDSSSTEKKTGVHLIPVVWKNRLLLLWPEFMEKVEPVETGDSRTYQSLSNQRIVDQQPKKHWETRLAWSEYYNGKWTAKKVTEDFFTIQNEFTVEGIDEREIELHQISFNINVNKLNSTLEIYLVPFMFDTNNGHLGISYTPTSPDSTADLLSAHHCFKLRNLSENVPASIAHPLLLSDVGGYMNRSEEGTFIRSAFRGEFRNEILKNRYEYEFSKTNNSLQPLVFSETYLARNRHQLLFSNQLKYEDDPAEQLFFYSTNDKNYFVQGINETNVQIGEGYFIGTMYFPGHVLITQLSYLKFNTFHHPYVSNFISNLNKNGVGTNDERNPGLLESDISIGASDGIYDDHGDYFEDTFDPNFPLVFEPSEENLRNPNKTYFKENICFDPYGANSKYNWELFFHAPLYIATQLSKNGKHREALKWFHYLFDPTTDAPVETSLGVNDIARFFKVKPFKTTPTDSFETFISELTANSAENLENAQIKEWKNNPFDPHLVASSFPVNYMKHVILAYVENLVQWADSLFRRFTRENVNEAIQLYVIAGHILGPKPQFIPKRGAIQKETYASISDRLNDLSNAYVSLENSLPYSSGSISDASGDSSASLLGIGSATYFCIPPNQKLIRYWDLVEDRLFKIRNCKDINGVARRLALFAPPIDPAALIKAKSAGLDLDTILSELSAPPPHYRFAYLLQKANEFCNDVKSLGAGVLSAIEKEEGEALSQLRSTHEIEMLGMVQKIKERQILDAKTAKELLEKQRETTIFRLNYYNETLLGNEAIEIAPLIDIDDELDDQSAISVNTDISQIAVGSNDSLDETSALKILSGENRDIQSRKEANSMNADASMLTFTASFLNLIPSFSAEFEPFGVGGSISYGGSNLASFTSGQASTMQARASILSQQGALASTTASYIRREQEWTLQANLAAKEIQQLERQILSAGVRVQIAEKDLENHKRQIENAQTIENYIKSKFSNKELYQWMKEQLLSLHKQSYDLAFELARKAEMAFEYEKGALESPIIGYGHFDNSKNGLLAGEKLQLGLRQMEIAFQEKNVRELELTKHVSLHLLDPEKLIMLKETGQCNFDLLEELFDFDYPGHFNRRIKSLSISIPCVAGPYTTLACTLRQKSSSIRVEPNFTSDLLERTAPISTISTSSAQNDSGVYELNFRDERYLPFEGSGVISNWDLELFHDAEADDFGQSLRQFDYSTISDVIVHIRYMALEDQGMKTEAISRLRTTLETGGNSIYKGFNLKQDFPSEWHKLINPSNPEDGNSLEFSLTENHFPFRDKHQNIAVNSLRLIARCSDNRDYIVRFNHPTLPIEAGGSEEMNLSQTHIYGNLLSAERNTSGENIEIDFSSENRWNLEITSPSGENLTENEIVDLFLIIEYNWKP